MNWAEYHERRKQRYLEETAFEPINWWTDEEKIALVEAGAQCYDPSGETGWEKRQWLEQIRCVKNHGVCTGCPAREICK